MHPYLKQRYEVTCKGVQVMCICSYETQLLDCFLTSSTSFSPRAVCTTLQEPKCSPET